MNNDVITRELIESVKTPASGFTRATLKLLGVEWPPQKGWVAKIIGKPIDGESLAALQRISEQLRDRNA